MQTKRSIRTEYSVRSEVCKSIFFIRLNCERTRSIWSAFASFELAGCKIHQEQQMQKVKSQQISLLANNSQLLSQVASYSLIQKYLLYQHLVYNYQFQSANTCPVNNGKNKEQVSSLVPILTDTTN